jgi:heptosyltransferase II
MENILIIKTGAIGDVVRTTSLLNVLKGNIYWITAEESKPILPENINGLKVIPLKEAFQSLKDIQFSQILSLEEDHDCARLASELKVKDLTGVYLAEGKINYTDSSAGWFDMSRVSKFGLTKANELKAANSRTYQDYIFEMIGEKFKAEPYQIFTVDTPKKDKLVGIETRTGKQWPNKQWWGYDELISRLDADNRPYKILKQRDDIRNYLEDIAQCSHIVSGDTLAMHIALAYGKTCTSLFNCTSPQEIYDYGLMKKIVSPLLYEYFYLTSYNKEVIESISLQDVYQTLPF